MNIIVSGWPGAGQTSLSILLAYSLGYKLFQGTNTFRLLGKKLNFSNEGADRIKADELLENHYGFVFDKYQKYFAESENKVIIESDLAGFYIKHPNVHEVFLTCLFETRVSRLGIERQDDIEFLKERDISLGGKYKTLFNVDFFDTEAIFKNYSQVFENTDMKIAQELGEIYRVMKVKGIFDDAKHDELVANAFKLEEEFWAEGKQAFIDKLIARGLIISAEEIIKDIKKLYKNEIDNFPEELRVAIESV